MTTQTTYGECFLISACATIKTLKHERWENDHLINKDGTLKEHVTDLKEVAKQTYLQKFLKLFATDSCKFCCFLKHRFLKITFYFVRT